MTEQTYSMRLRPWAIARGALVEAFCRPLSTLRRHYEWVLLAALHEAFRQFGIGDPFQDAGSVRSLGYRWMIEAVVDVCVVATMSIYFSRYAITGEYGRPFAVLLPIRRLLMALVYTVAFVFAFVFTYVFFGVAIWPFGSVVSSDSIIGAMLGIVWLVIVWLMTCRLSPLFVMIVIDRKGPILEFSWLVTRGQTWRIVAAFTLAVAPFVGCIVVLAAAPDLAGLDSESWQWRCVEVAVIALYNVAMCQVVSAVGVNIYRQLVASRDTP